MYPDKAQILSRLKREILPLQGYTPSLHNSVLDQGLGSIRNAFPNHSFPLGAIHEFLCETDEDAAATRGFIAAMASILMQKTGISIWISKGQSVYPPSLKQFGLLPEKVIFVEAKKEKEILWVLEEALKCDGLSFVSCELQELSFTASRRLQLAVEQSKVTGFILRVNPRYLNTTTSLARWQIKSLPSETIDGLPGVGFPRWQVELLRVRNGKPGSWQIEWIENGFRHIEPVRAEVIHLQKKTG
jgi:protein ImuA